MTKLGLGLSGDLGAQEIVRMLDLQPHPEGGWYRQTFQDAPGPDGRAASTCIYYLLEAEQMSAWHRVDAVEISSFTLNSSFTSYSAPR